MSAARVWLAAALLALAPVAAAAQEAETRAGQLRQARAEKAASIEPPQPSALERALLDLENGRLFERILNPAQGLYPKFGNITAGSGFAIGPAWRAPARLGGHADLSAVALGSFQRYWLLEARLQLPRLLDERVALDLHARRFGFPDEDFFGLGPAAARDDHVTYALRGSSVGGAAGWRPARWLTLGGAADYLTPSVGAGSGDGLPTIGARFDDGTAPGVAEQPSFLRSAATVEVNTREPRGNPRAGGRYALTYERFDDRDAGRYSFQRLDADVQHYVSLLRQRRILALRGLVSIADPAAGARMPFYLQRTLGGPDDLRGFRRFRFRDRHALLLQAEYRWEIFTAVDGAIFYDAGKVASRIEDLTLRDLETDYGIGFRVGTRNGVFLRAEGAFGSRDGKHFILRFGNVF